MQVDVVMPVYNGGEFLSQAIQSVLVQSHRDFRLILIDDGSTDDSLSIATGYSQRDKRICLITRPNKGLVDTLNEGVGLCENHYIFRMDADDICLPDRFSRQLAFMEQNPSVAVVGSQFWIVDREGNELGHSSYPTDPVDIEKKLICGSVLAHPATCIRRETLLKTDGYRKAYSHAEDYDLWLRISEFGHLRNIDTCLLKYRTHGENISSTKRFEQELRTEFAVLTYLMRRAGLPDPTSDMDPLNIGDYFLLDTAPLDGYSFSQAIEKAVLRRSVLPDSLDIMETYLKICRKDLDNKKIQRLKYLKMKRKLFSRLFRSGKVSTCFSILKG